MVTRQNWLESLWPVLIFLVLYIVAAVLLAIFFPLTLWSYIFVFMLFVVISLLITSLMMLLGGAIMKLLEQDKRDLCWRIITALVSIVFGLIFSAILWDLLS